jgi:HEAT repeat protein
MDAIRELCRRGHVSAIPPIVDVLEELSPEEVPGAVVALLGFGERAADGLMFALAAPSQLVRHACALGLGQLELARSLPILIRQIEAESTPSWQEMARALGDFGAAALGPVTEALRVSDRRERLMLGLAHLANHGCVSEVKSLESDPDLAVSQAARQALVRRARMEAEDAAVRTQQRLRDNSPEVRFSQAFFAEVARASG